MKIELRDYEFLIEKPKVPPDTIENWKLYQEGKQQIPIPVHRYYGNETQYDIPLNGDVICDLKLEVISGIEHIKSLQLVFKGQFYIECTMPFFHYDKPINLVSHKGHSRMLKLKLIDKWHTSIKIKLSIRYELYNDMTYRKILSEIWNPLERISRL